jgi:selenocysteine-specific elongation factor
VYPGAVRSLIVGTAGHIDHGKSSLVRALTGTDPDRLKEEQERGITIDLGFAHLDLGGGPVVSFIDVPGHERFVRNMLAGAHGIDAVLLVVAAEESVMPQTREHFHICRLLGIPRGLVALTKCDLADPDSQALAEMEVREMVAGSFLEGAPVLRVSARSGQGMDDLRAALRGLAAEPSPREGQGLLRLPVDRSFSLKGFGTVITGTLVSGALAVGDEVEVLPSGRRVRVRGLQVHGAAVPRVDAGNRAAVNLAGVEVADVVRGDVLARPGTLRPTSIVEVDLSLLPGEAPLKDQARVRVHLASAELLARVRVPEGAVRPGPAVRVQLRLERPGVAGRGDRVIVRSYSPVATIGGAVVADPLARKRNRGTAAAVPAASAERSQAAAALVAQAGVAGVTAAELAARLTVPQATLLAEVSGRPDVAVFGTDPVWLLSGAALDELAGAARSALERFHREHPLRAAMPREELRRRVFAACPEGVFDQVVAGLSARGEARVEADGVSAGGHQVRLSGEESRARQVLVDAARAAGLEGVDPARLAGVSHVEPRTLTRVGQVLVADGTLRRVGEVLVDRERLDALQVDVRRRWPPGSRLDVGAFKEMTGLSRKFVIPLLEYLDRERVTRRSGADRLVLG